MAAGKRRNESGIIAIFRYLDDVCQAMDKIEGRQGFEDHEVISHSAYHELYERAERRYGESEVRWFTLVGGVTGASLGFGMPLWMDYDWPLVVGGKTAGLPSLPAYFVFGFEVMVLLGAIATIAGMLWMGRLPNPGAKIYDNRLTQDCFGIFVPGVDQDSDQAKLLREYGAEDIKAT